MTSAAILASVLRMGVISEQVKKHGHRADPTRLFRRCRSWHHHPVTDMRFFRGWSADGGAGGFVKFGVGGAGGERLRDD